MQATKQSLIEYNSLHLERFIRGDSKTVKMLYKTCCKRNQVSPLIDKQSFDW